MYYQARAEDLTFYETARAVRRAVADGRLQSLASDTEFMLHKVGYPFTRPATRTFVKRLGVQYRTECGAQLEVTSAVRPATRQPANSVAISVHPTGMAVDLHKPKDAKCLRWLRSTLIDLEEAGVLEATEEFAPPHFHVAVYETPYRRYLAAQTPAGERRQLASNQPVDVSSYRVRPGDTLWAIARKHDTTVDALVSANHLNDKTIKPGQQLVIPSGG
jgi:nucleoid-associated protein YgaU